MMIGLITYVEMHGKSRGELTTNYTRGAKERHVLTNAPRMLLTAR